MTIEFVNECSVSLVGSLVSDDDVAMAAWVSFDQDSEERLENREQVRKLIKFLYSNKHMSPFEHGILKFRVDVPIFVAREFHRHRTQSYNEVSGRYTEMKPRFYIPPRERPLVQKGKPGDYFFVEGDDEQYAVVKRNMEITSEYAWNSYQHMLSYGVAKEVARMVLPLNLMTQFYASVNPRNLMQFLTLRNDSHALYEIRGTARQMESHLAELMPFTYEAYNDERNTKELKNKAQLVQNISVTSNNTVEEAAALVDHIQRAFERKKHVLPR